MSSPGRKLLSLLATAVAIRLAFAAGLFGCPVVGAQSSIQAGDAQATNALQEHRTTDTADRQKKLVNDADQLIALTLKLKASVDKSNKDTLSIDVVRNAERIEKLARQMREAKKQ